MSTESKLGGTNQATAGDSLADMFYPLYTKIFSEDSDFVRNVEVSLAESRNSDNVELYLSRSLAYGVITGVVLWLLGITIGYVLFGTGIINLGDVSSISIPNEQLATFIEVIKLPAFVLITGLILGSIGLFGTFGAFVLAPQFKSSERKREIEQLMSSSVSFMYALSVGGMNQLEIIEAMAKAEETYGAVSQEFQTISRETKYFDTDYRTAIQQQAEETPSPIFSQFLMDMLSVLDSGGDLERFLEEKKEKHLRHAKQHQERTLDTLELFGEMYMTLSLFPLLLIIVLVAMSLLGNAQMTLIAGVVYGLLPIIGVAFIVLISTVKQDEIGTGKLTLYDESKQAQIVDNVVVQSGIVSEYQGNYRIFDSIRESEDTYNTIELLKAPHWFFRDNPVYVLALTTPASIAIVAIAMASGAVPTTLESIKNNPVWPTFVYFYIPAYLNLLPLAFFYEWNQRYRYGVLTELSDTLRKLASANDTGQTLFEAMNTVSETSRGRLADEFGVMYAKVQYGMSLKEALVEFNNKYKIPRLARTIKLISKAQETSSQITKVLTTAAQQSQNQDDIEMNRKSQARMQVVIIMMTYLTLLFVMAILKTQFIEVMADLVNSGSSSGGGSGGGGGGGGASFGGSIDVNLLSMMFFHAVTLQALISGLVAGYMRDGKVISGLKYSVILMTIALITWMYVG